MCQYCSTVTLCDSNPHTKWSIFTFPVNVCSDNKTEITYIPGVKQLLLPVLFKFHTLICHYMKLRNFVPNTTFGPLCTRLVQSGYFLLAAPAVLLLDHISVRSCICPDYWVFQACLLEEETENLLLWNFPNFARSSFWLRLAGSKANLWEVKNVKWWEVDCRESASERRNLTLRLNFVFGGQEVYLSYIVARTVH